MILQDDFGDLGVTCIIYDLPMYATQYTTLRVPQTSPLA